MGHLKVVGALAWATPIAACLGDSANDLPPVAGLVDQREIQFEWPWCDAELPRVRECGEFGSLSEIGGVIAEESVCTLVSALQEWLAARSWNMVDTVKVCRTDWFDVASVRDSSSSERQPTWSTYLVADIPERRTSVNVFLNEETEEITFRVNSR